MSYQTYRQPLAPCVRRDHQPIAERREGEAGLGGRGRRGEFVWLLSFFRSSNQMNQTNQRNQIDQTDRPRSERFVSTTYSEIRDHSLKSLLLSSSHPNKRQPDELPPHPLHTRAINHERPLQAGHLSP
jgi:hypothetical protein